MARDGMGGRTFRPRDLDSTVSNNDFGCYPGQQVTIARGLPERCNPSRVTVVGEYPYQIVFNLEFDLDDSTSGASKASWNYSITKVALMCGDAVVKDARGHDIRPRQKEEPRRSRRRDGGERHPHGRRGEYAGGTRRFDWYDDADDLLGGPGKGRRGGGGGYDDSLI